MGSGQGQLSRLATNSPAYRDWTDYTVIEDSRAFQATVDRLHLAQKVTTKAKPMAGNGKTGVFAHVSLPFPSL
jgi:hypothetical protein